MKRSERLYDRFGVLAVFVGPSWGAGIARMSTVKFLLANAGSAALWAVLYGVGSYVAGHTLTDLFADIGLAGAALLAAVIVFGGAVGILRRRRHLH